MPVSFEFIERFLFTLGQASFSAALALAVIFVFSRVRKRGQDARRPAHDVEMDFTNMLILFRSMRDLLQQQKVLARDLNSSVEKKVAEVHRCVDQAMAEVARLRESQRQLAVQLEDARSDRPGAASDKGDSLLDTLSPGQSMDEPDAAPQETPVDSVLRVVAEPPPRGASNDPTESWVGLDFGNDQPDPLGFEVPEHVPEKPEDPQAARDAFRALLDLDPQDGAPLGKVARTEQAKQGNGQSSPSRIHAQVYDYSDAGMTVPQISRELGIGKGEVRLVLSLRKDRGG
jgi:uncharacterized protein YoxC